MLYVSIPWGSSSATSMLSKILRLTRAKFKNQRAHVICKWVEENFVCACPQLVFVGGVKGWRWGGGEALQVLSLKESIVWSNGNQVLSMPIPDFKLVVLVRLESMNNPSMSFLRWWLASRYRTFVFSKSGSWLVSLKCCT